MTVRRSCYMELGVAISAIAMLRARDAHVICVIRIWALPPMRKAMDAPIAPQFTCPRGLSLCDEQPPGRPHETVIETPDVLARQARWAKPAARDIPERSVSPR